MLTTIITEIREGQSGPDRALDGVLDVLVRGPERRIACAQLQLGEEVTSDLWDYYQELKAYQDPTTKEAAWVAVDFAPFKTLKTPVTLAQIKADEYLKDMQLVKLQRLSVSIVKPEEFDRVCMLGGM